MILAINNLFMKKIILFFTYFLVSGITLHSQSKQYFEDEGLKDIRHFYQVHKVKDGTVISAKMFNDDSEVPIILRLDINGDLLWSTGSCLNLMNGRIKNFKYSIYDDKYLYGVIQNIDINNDIKIVLCKVDINTGELIWITDEIEGYQYLATNKMEDLNPDSFLLGLTNDNYNLHLVDKLTGKLTLIHQVSALYDFIVDYSGNILFSDVNGISKFNGLDFNDLLWVKKFEDFEYIARIYEDKFGDIYVFDTTAKLKKINAINGNEIWNLNDSSSITLSDLKETNDHLHLAFRHIYVGSYPSRYSYLKVDKITGNIAFRSYNNMNTLGSPASYSGHHQAALSIDLDCEEDVFMTGYYGHSNYGPAAFGIMKVDGNSGEKISDLTITNFPDTYDRVSSGITTCVFGEKPTFYGYLEGGFLYNYPVYISTDNSLGKVEVKNIKSDFKFSSTVIDIIKQNNTIYILKQIGNKVGVEKYDSNMNKFWSVIISEGFLVKGDKMIVGQNNIFVALRSFEGDNKEMLLYKLSENNGEIINSVTVEEKNFEINSGSFFTNYSTFELEVDGDELYIYYSHGYSTVYNDGALWIRKWGETGLSDATPSYSKISLKNVKPNQNFVVNYGDNLYQFGDKNINIFNKSSSEITKSNTIQGNSGTSGMLGVLQNNNLAYYYGQLPIDFYSNPKKQYIVCKNLDNLEWGVWFKQYDEVGSINRLIYDGSEFIYALGKAQNNINIKKIEASSGNLIWSTIRPLNGEYQYALPLDISYDQLRNRIRIFSSYIKNDSSTDFNYETFDLGGNLIDSVFDEELLNEVINPITLSLENDEFLLGGAITTNCNDSKGFLHQTKIVNLDDDNDGVFYYDDLCPNTPQGQQVNNKGCLILPFNSFNIQTISETCPDKNNAKIIINPTEPLNYVATLAGIEYNFTTDLTIENLAPGDYELCIEIPAESYEQCYNILLREGSTISGKSSVDSGKVSFAVNGGTPPYNVSKNGVVVLQTYNTSFAINASRGDTIEVTTEKDCEGSLSKTVAMADTVVAYPNPTTGNFEITIPVHKKQVTVNIYSIQSQLLSSDSYLVEGGKIRLDINDRPNGIYLAKVYAGEPVILKIIKR